MQDIIIVDGIVGTDSRHVTTAAGLEVTSFRLASSNSRFDQTKNEWVGEDTNWYSVVAFGALAAAAAQSVHKRDRVVVRGRLKLQQNRDDAGNTRQTAEIVADAIGTDIRPRRSAGERDAEGGPERAEGDRELQPVGWAAPGADSADIPF